MTQAYPLYWPQGWPRTAPAKLRDARNKWGRGEGRKRRPWMFGEARDELFAELERFGGKDIVLSSNYRLTRDGRPSRNFGVPEDQAIAIYFTIKGKPMVMAQDGYTRAEENLRSLALVLKYLRGVEELGGGTMMEKTFEGFTALPSPTGNHWSDVLGVSRSATQAEINAAYRDKARTAHSDTGGSDAAMSRLNVARDQALKERGAS